MNKATYTFLISVLLGAFGHISNATSSFLQPTGFPKTSADASFTTRTENAAAGYAPYAGHSAYQTLKIETEEQYIDRMVKSAEAQSQRDLATLSRAEYCNLYPLDDQYCPQAPGLTESIIAIGNRPSVTQQQSPQPQQQRPTYPQQQGQGITQSQQTGQGSIQQIVPQIISPTIPHTQNNNAFNGQCTPPQRSNHFPNKILTSGKYANIDPAFEKAMITIFRTEGECGYDPDDSGGYTCYGVSQKNNPEVDVRNITRADAEDIAYKKYYTQYNIDKLPDTSRGNVFILGWAGGTVTGIRRFCKFLGIPQHDKIDDTVVSAAANYPGDIHNDFLDNQQQFYIDVSKRGNNKKFLKGWMNRVQLMRENGCHTETTAPLTR